MRRPGGAESGRGRGRAGGRYRRALTLIELVVALVIALALAAVVLPAAAGRLRAAGLGEVASRVEAGVMLACAEAQRRGEVLELVVAVGGTGELGLYTRPVGGAAGESEGHDASPLRELGEPLTELPGGVRLVVSDDGTVSGGDGPGAGGGTAPGEGAEPLTVAVILPDGTVVRELDPLTFEDAGGWTIEVRIGGWTGRVSAGDVRPPATEGEEPTGAAAPPMDAEGGGA